MWAMMPMLRTLASALAAVATVFLPSSLRAQSAGWRSALTANPTSGCVSWPAVTKSPPVVRERLVGLGHLVGVLTTLHRGPEAVARVQQFVLQPLDHGLLAAGLGVLHDPAQTQGGLPGGTDLDRHLVGRATDAAAANLEGRLDVVHRALERHHRVGAGLLARTLEGAVHDPLGQGPLALGEDLVDQLRD